MHLWLRIHTQVQTPDPFNAVKNRMNVGGLSSSFSSVPFTFCSPRLLDSERLVLQGTVYNHLLNLVMSVAVSKSPGSEFRILIICWIKLYCLVSILNVLPNNLFKCSQVLEPCERGKVLCPLFLAYTLFYKHLSCPPLSNLLSKIKSFKLFSVSSVERCSNPFNRLSCPLLYFPISVMSFWR